MSSSTTLVYLFRINRETHLNRWPGDPLFEFLDPDLLIRSLYNFHGATMTNKGILQASIAIVKAFLTWNVPSKIGQKSAFWGKMESKCEILFSEPRQKVHPCAKWHYLTYRSWKSVQGSSLYGVARTPQKTSRVTLYAQARAGVGARVREGAKPFIGS